MSADACNALKCPVCKNFLSAPVRSCIYGHLICEQCYENSTSNNCIECRSKDGYNTRNITIEMFLEMFRTVCKYGCKEQITVQEANKHFAKCKYR